MVISYKPVYKYTIKAYDVKSKRCPAAKKYTNNFTFARIIRFFLCIRYNTVVIENNHDNLKRDINIISYL